MSETGRPAVVRLRRLGRRTWLQLLRLWGRARLTERQRLLALTVLVGAACGFAAVGFHVGIQKLETLLFSGAADRFDLGWIPWIILTPTVGALIAGLLLHRFFPDARGSGIPQVKAAYAQPGGSVSLRTAAGKFGVGIIQIGTGSSLGREGPTVQICAGVASWIGRAAGLSRKSLRRLLPVGAAAGVAAAFNAPIAAVTFAIEEIVGDLDQAVLSGVIIAAAVAAAIERSVLGEHPVFEISQQYGLEETASLLLYAILGVLAAAVSIAFTDSLLSLRARFRRMRLLPAWARPAVGGFVAGVAAVTALLLVRSQGILGGGYATLGEALHGSLTLQTLIVLGALKFVATLFSYASGGAGGIFAPALFLGGMLGGAVGHLDRILFPGGESQVGAFALVGMGAVFAGIVRAPMTSVLIIFEMTDGYGLILPLMIANMTAYGLARRWRTTPIYEALLEQDGIHLPRRASQIGAMPVIAAMKTRPATIPSACSIDQALLHVASHEYTTFPVVDAEGRFDGFVTRPQLAARAAAGGGARPVLEAISRAETVLPNEPLHRAAVRMDSAGIHVVAVIEDPQSRKFVGILTSSDLVRAQASAAHSDFDETRH